MFHPAPSVVIVILAAGKSSRMGSGGEHKLLTEFEGIPLIRRSTLVALGCESTSVVVVTGHRHLEIQNAIADLDVQIVHNEDYASGLAGSLGLGVKSAETLRPDGIMIMLADMPSLTTAKLNLLITSFQSHHGNRIIRAGVHGIIGNPVIFPRLLYDKLQNLSGDVGAKSVIEFSRPPAVQVDIGDDAFTDVDTPDQVIAAGGVLKN